MNQRGAIFACVIALAALLPAAARAQIPGTANIQVGGTNIIGGTSGRCLYDNAGKIGETASCGLAGGVTVGTSVITGGTNGRILYDNSGVVGETVTGTGVLTALGVNVGSAGAFTTQSTGTWTPVLTFATPGNLSVSYSLQLGAYIKTNKLVSVSFNILTSSFTQTTASGNLTITGLPFAAANDGISPFGGTMQFGGITKATYTQFMMDPVINTTTMIVGASGSGVAQANVTASDTPSGGTVRLQGSVTYWTD